MKSRESFFKDRQAKEQLTPLWQGWLFDGTRIIDKAGNIYTRRDIELSFYAGQIIDNFQGTDSTVTSLKKELERRKELLALPKVCIIYESTQGVIEKVFDLTEIV